MFNAISWSQYINTVIIILVIYYIAVLTIYYKPEIRNLFSKKNAPHTDVNGPRE